MFKNYFQIILLLLALIIPVLADEPKPDLKIITEELRLPFNPLEHDAKYVLSVFLEGGLDENVAYTEKLNYYSMWFVNECNKIQSNNGEWICDIAQFSFDKFKNNNRNYYASDGKIRDVTLVQTKEKSWLYNAEYNINATIQYQSNAKNVVLGKAKSNPIYEVSDIGFLENTTYARYYKIDPVCDFETRFESIKDETVLNFTVGKCE